MREDSEKIGWCPWRWIGRIGFVHLKIIEPCGLLGCIFGAKQEDEIWRKRYNFELYETFNDSNIVNYIKVKRLAWLAGHLMCVNDNRTANKICNTKLGGVRRVGRPKMRWEGSVDQDMRILDVENWKKVALNRDEWAKLLKKPRAHQGLSSE
jgi:hypothetical protein